MQLQLLGDQSGRILGRQLLLHLPHRLPKLPGLHRFFSHPDISFKIEMCLPCQGGQGCFDIDECTLSEGVSFSSPLIFATYHLISNQICKFSSSCSHLNLSSKQLITFHCLTYASNLSDQLLWAKYKLQQSSRYFHRLCILNTLSAALGKGR